MLPALIGAIPGVLNAVGGLFDKKRSNQQEGKAVTQLSQLADIFKEQAGMNYFDSAEAQGAINQINQNQQNSLSQIDANANINGLTDEARLAMKGNVRKASAGAYSDLARSASLWKNRQQQMYQGTLGQLFGMGTTNRQMHNQSMANITQPLQETIGGAFNAGLFDK